MKIRKTLLALVVTGTVAATPSVPATATPSASDAPGAISVENGKEVAHATTAEQQARIEDAITDGTITLHTEASNLDFDSSTYSVNTKGETLVIVPIDNEGMEYSNLSVILSDAGEIARYAEAHFTEKTSNSGHVTAWLNGEKVKDEDVTAPESPRRTTRSAGDAVSELNRCLSDAGIPAWVVAAAATLCSVGGSVPGFIACLIAAGVGGGTATYCAQSAWDKL